MTDSLSSRRRKSNAESAEGEVEALDTDEQQAVVDELTSGAASQQKWTRQGTAFLAATTAIIVCKLALDTAARNIQGMDTFVTTELLLGAFGGTLVALACALITALGKKTRAISWVSCAAALLPGICAWRGPHTPLMLSLGVLAPIAVIIAEFVDRDMIDLDKKVAALSDARYEYKKV